MLKHTILIAFIVGSLVANSEAFSLFGGQDGFTKLNDYLVEKEESTDLGKNMALVQGLLNEEGVSQKSDSLAKAASTFAELAQIEGKCDAASVEILRENVKGTNGAGHAKHPPARRLDNLVHQYALQHAKECPKVYQQMAESKLAMLEPKTRELAESFSTYMTATLKQQIKDEDARYSLSVPDGELFLKRAKLGSIMAENMKSYGAATIKAIRSAGRDDMDSIRAAVQANGKKDTLSVNLEKLQELFDKYVLHPCKSYSDSMADVYEAAEFDAEIYDDPYYSEGFDSFRNGLITNRICKLAVEQISKLLFKKMVKNINQVSKSL